MTEDNRDYRNKGFEKWKEKVNSIIEHRINLSVDEIPDVNYYDMYESGCTPSEAATEAIEYAMEN